MKISLSVFTSRSPKITRNTPKSGTRSFNVYSSQSSRSASLHSSLSRIPPFRVRHSRRGKFICNMLLEPCRPHHKRIFFWLFLLFSWQIFCGKAKNVSVYYLPRTDEVDRSVITCVKRIFLIHSPFLYKRQKSESSDACVFLIRIVGETFVNFF